MTGMAGSQTMALRVSKRTMGRVIRDESRTIIAHLGRFWVCSDPRVPMELKRNWLAYIGAKLRCFPELWGRNIPKSSFFYRHSWRRNRWELSDLIVKSCNYHRLRQFIPRADAFTNIGEFDSMLDTFFHRLSELVSEVGYLRLSPKDVYALVVESGFLSEEDFEGMFRPVEEQRSFTWVY